MAHQLAGPTREDVRGPYARGGGGARAAAAGGSAPAALASAAGDPLPDATVRLLERMPKAELHLHLDGSIRVDTALDLARARGIDAPTTWADMSAALVGPPQGPDQAELLRAFDLPIALMQDADPLRAITV